MRVLLAQINPIVGDLNGNRDKILKGISIAKEQRADLVLFPEMCLTGYPPEDFLLLPHFIRALQEPLKVIQAASKGIVAIVGTPRHIDGRAEKSLYNSAAIFSDGQLLGFQDKGLLPTYDVFDELRYFEPSESSKVWTLCGKKVAVTICEDIWQHSALLNSTNYSRDPILELQEKKPDLVVNLSASPFSLANVKNRLTAGKKAALTLSCPLLLCNQTGGNDGLIFDGHSFHIGKSGELLHIAKGFDEDFVLIDLSASPQPIQFHEEPAEALYKALVLGVKDYFQKSGFSRACIGLSGGIDSALVACIAVEALGKENVLALGMPSRYSSEGSKTDAAALARNLSIAYQEIPIEKPFSGYLELLGPCFKDLPSDATEENLQARIRGMILMAFSNKLGYIVLSTGNKSELAMGYATLYGDMCGGLAVLSDVTKEQVYEISRWINREKEIIPSNTILKPPSAELRPNQKDTDSLPEYSVVDNVLKAYVEQHLSPEEIAEKFGYSLEQVKDLVRRIHSNEYKRRQSAPGLRVSEKAFSVGRRFPIVQRWIDRS